MTDSSPLPPSEPLQQLSVSSVMAGQLLDDVDTGEQTVAPLDLVLLIFTVDGEQRASYSLTPPQAMDVARALSGAVGRLVSAEIDDDGKPLGPLARLQRLRSI